ncbi:WEB family protein At3g02930, chloroplastic-like isoform X1 [Vigna umbellata]|uniref:WEB family protein At3g02930, chloroplastic-like isoform X1 n=1 Tax=Vigna umbellata TaxID=87088 RepID=UPI001F5EC464|nr:WEB family protein At3g02930, chloroplastic-like isoform X1 [Vigna umbellata]
MASKSRPNLSENPSKGSMGTTRISKASKVVSKSESESQSPLQNSRLSVERSPRSVNSKPTIERKSPRPSATPPDKQPPRAAKGSELLQNQLNLAQEDLKKAKELLIQAEKEKLKAIDELKEAQRVAEEANDKLREALVVQKRAEENSEIERFRAVELEQAGIETVKKKEEEWKKEIESVRNQHALDMAALLSTTQELQRVKQELAMTCDAKNQALNHADDATKIAEIQAEKAEFLSAELLRLKALLDAKLETQAGENQVILKLKTEIEALNEELEKAKGYADKLSEKEGFIEHLNVELEASKMAESYSRSLLEEWHKKVEELEMRIEEANRLERSASESLESVMKQLEGSNDLLHEAESEVTTLKEKVGLLEMTIGRHRADVEDSERQLRTAKEESLEKSKEVEALKSEIEKVKEEKAQALNDEKLAASSVQTLLEEKNKLISELENSRDEEEKSKKAMESLASALHEVSAEAREAKENLLNIQAERESYEAQIEDLKLVLKATNEKYESMLDEARHEIDVLVCSIENSKSVFENSKVEWEQREHHLVSCIKKNEEEKVSLEKEIKRLLYLLKETEEEANINREEEAQLKENLKEVEAEAIQLQEALKEATAENMKLKENLLDKENELQSMFEENDELRMRESESMKKVEELSKLLEEATTINHTEENGDLTDSEKDYDLLPKVVEFSEENGHVKDDISKVELSVNQEELKQNIPEESIDKAENIASPKPEEVVSEKVKEEDETKEKEDSVEGEFKMWESCKIEKKEFSPEREAEPESFEEEVDSKVEEGGESFDKINGNSVTENIDEGGSPPPKQQQQQSKKKKKPLLGKFGSLLKKKGAANQK